MKFNASTEINQSIDKVVEVFADPSHLINYQRGFIKKELISGELGAKGAVSKIYMKHGKHDMELTETVIENKLPDSFEAFYHHKHMDNTMKTMFTAVADGKTRYDTEIEYTRINWVLPRLMFILFKGMYRKHGELWMNDFKAYVESI